MRSCSSSSGTNRARSTALNSLKNGVEASASAALRLGGATWVAGEASGGGEVSALITPLRRTACASPSPIAPPDQASGSHRSIWCTTSLECQRRSASGEGTSIAYRFRSLAVFRGGEGGI